MTPQTTIGLLGGHTLLTLGPSAQVQAFLDPLPAALAAMAGLRAALPPAAFGPLFDDKKRPLAEFDRLRGDPFWLR